MGECANWKIDENCPYHWKSLLGNRHDSNFDQLMPLLKLETTVTLSDDQRQQLLASLSKIVAETIGKPEQYVMVTIGSAAILMSGKPGDAAFVDVRSIGGLDTDVNGQLSQKVCALLTQSLRVPQNRIYLNFSDVEAGNWGWNGSTFG
jgi:phenylpyruvate tautomerase